MEKEFSNNQHFRALSEIISVSSFRKIIKNNDHGYYYSKIIRFYDTLNQYFDLDSSMTNRQLLNKIYNLLATNYRNEYFYKNYIINNILLKNYKLSSTVALNEFKVSNSIADLVLINGKAKVYEIKTELDNFDRLSNQLNDYLKVFTDITVVGHESNKNKLIGHLNDTSFGLIILNDVFEISTIKSADSNYSLLDHQSLLNCLRKNEISSILKELFGYIPNVPNTKFYKESLNLILQCDLIAFQKKVLNQLKRRNIQEPEYISKNEIPGELKHICYNLDFSKKEYTLLFSFLNTPLNNYLKNVSSIS